ncbi:uncharacterized protein ASPGLDRAFT_32815 [Aspergillus glaucus CBS 516.65]|uniref:Uncharacterized protein n=1 Tax=Aspergillus glaucus CBS 516.65 TaxID=1160497 RepID=A0A1L9VT46_ASPGL|nr:hypothetical protein ASPGLDRAFT_32815 [Aspergillus glaucus CBS 516.65]OJJ87087.1 hypothetical protein ASPGLDRAFT_32815 [Aspergillus glaucus CBS 516.65]
MCHQITWYHAVCYHQDSAYNLRISCRQALKVGYECYRLECTLIPVFGACLSCKHEKSLAKGKLSPMRACADESSRPQTPGTFSSTLSNVETELEPQYSVGNDSGIFLDGGDEDVVGFGEDNHIDELELFDLITF